ncbi:BTB/POZ domain-containing protein [Trifolium pratense]|uniref:BTB/POZ domain-containing protein n=1 Tax=Trifolium pratense TaxID=57577 RepID=A0A2K3NUA9_TRIPR|nr:BTB/POZ domain-containing protein [Trifolium pratense]
MIHTTTTTKSSAREKENDRSLSSHILTLHRRLLHALNLGTRYFDDKTNQWKWQCVNIEVQKNVLRSITAFLHSISSDARATRHTIVKESAADILGALLWILQCKNEPLLSMASNVAVKLVSVLPSSLLQLRMLDLVYCLSSLLSSHQVEVAIPCATALNSIISGLSATSEKAVIEALKETEISICIVRNIKDCSAKKIEYFVEMASLLSTILLRWPSSRFPVCNDVELMKVLANMHTKTDSSIKLVLLKLYTSLALCDSVAQKLIEDGKVFLQMIVQAMGKSNPHDVRIEGFRLAQCLLRSQENCLKVMDLCGEALVDAIICGMRETGPCSKKIENNYGSVLVEACKLALITRWAGDHHIKFWKQGIDKVLLNLLIENIHDQSSEFVLSLEKQISMVKEGLKVNYHVALRSYVWDILGWLTIHCGENSNPYGNTQESELHINLLILCACLPQYQRCIIESRGIQAVVRLVQRCLSNDIHVERPEVAPHLHTVFHKRSCCWICKGDWEGSNVLLFYGLWGLAEFLHQCGLLLDNPQQFTREVTNIKTQLVNKLHEICSNTSFSPGVKWYVSYILSYFGFYGFPNEYSKRIGMAFNKEEYADLRLIVANGDSVGVHGVILAVRCPSILPSKMLSGTEEETVKKLKILAKRCNLQPLLQMLCRQSPKWGIPFPGFTLTSSLDSAGSYFSDVIMEAKLNEPVGWACNICSHPVPHLHVHKVILQSGCDYLQGLFRSGMQESHSQVIKVDISWEALTKLAHWFYSDELPNPPSGCLWFNMDDQEKLFNLQPYVELCWLGEFWIMESIQEACWNVIMSCLDSSKQLSIKIIKMAYKLSLWKLVDIAANLMAPSYRQLRDSGELEEFDDALVHFIYSASIELNHEGEKRFT